MIGLIKKLIFFVLSVILFTVNILADNNHPLPPVIPNVQAIYDHEKITVYWDRDAESSIDSLSGYSDFEGYRIYRSSDGGETWGSYWDKIYDYEDPSNHVGWEPMAQYDIRGLRDSTHCIYSNGYYEDNVDGEKCYSNSIIMKQIDIGSLIPILDKQYNLIDTMYQEINSADGAFLRSNDLIDDIMKFSESLSQDSLVIDTLYESINTNDISLDSLDKLLKLNELYFEPTDKPCSDNVSNNWHDCKCGPDGLWTGNECLQWNGAEYSTVASTGKDWDRTSFFIPIISGDVIDPISNRTDSLDRLISKVPGIEIDTIFHSINTGNIDKDSIEVLLEIGGMSIDTVMQPITTGNIDADSIDVLIGMGALTLKTVVGGYIDTVFHAISIIGCQYGQLCTFDSTCGTEDETLGYSFVCDGTTILTDSMRILHSTLQTGFKQYNADSTIITKCDWYVLPNSSLSIINYPDWKALPTAVDVDGDGDLDSSKSIISVPDWTVIDNCTSILNVPDFTIKSSGCLAYGAEGVCNDPDLTSSIIIKVPSWKIQATGSAISVPDWWVSDNSQSSIRMPEFYRNEGVSGYHELALWTNIGSDASSNKGLFRSFTDPNVLDGVEYTYAVTAYDMGLKTYTVDFVDELSEPFYDKNNNGERGDGVELPLEYYIDIDENAKCNEITDGIFSVDTVWSNANPDHLKGINERGYPSFETPIFYESFTDYNANGICDSIDIEEPFVDENGDGIWNERINPTNVISIVAGYKGSNRVFPKDSSLVKADATNIGNGSELYRIVNIDDVQPKIIRFEVNAKLDSNAFGDASGSFPTQKPSIYAWEVASEANIIPNKTFTIIRDDIQDELNGYTDLDIQSCSEGWECLCIENWEIGSKLKNNSDGSSMEYNCRKNLSSFCDSDCKNECVEDCISLIQDLPGATYDETSQQFTLPDYLIDNFILSANDNPNYESYWTDWLYGVQFRFDNGPDDMPLKINIKSISFSDPNMKDIISVDMAYQSLGPAEFRRRPGFIYKIEFGEITNATLTAPLSSCQDNDYPIAEDGNQLRTFLPYTISNTTLNKEPSLAHYDKGTESGEIDFGLAPPNSGCDGLCLQIYGDICYWFNCIPATGYKDCFWQSSEVLKLIDTVYTSNGYGPDGLTGLGAANTNNSLDDGNPFAAKLFQFSIAVDKAKYYEHFGVNPLSLDSFNVATMYAINDIVYHEGWLWQAISSASLSTEPNDWLDDGNSTNINPWKVLYPWEEGSYIIVEPYGWFADGDSWIVNLASLDETDDNPIDDLDNISVVPNPYIVFSDFDQGVGNHNLRFTRLPLKCIITIYTINGELVRTIYHEEAFDGNEVWDLKNEAGLEVAPGLYIYVVETDNTTKIDKFAIIR